MRIKRTTAPGRPAPQPIPGRGHDPGLVRGPDEPRASAVCLSLNLPGPVRAASVVNVNYVQGFEATSLATQARQRPGNVLRQPAVPAGLDRHRRPGRSSRTPRLNKNFGVSYQRHYSFGKDCNAPVTGFYRHAVQPDRDSSRLRTRTWPEPDPALEVAQPHRLDQREARKKKKKKNGRHGRAHGQLGGPAGQPWETRLKLRGGEKRGGLVGRSTEDGGDPRPSPPLPPSTRTWLATAVDGKKADLKNDKRLLADPRPHPPDQQRHQPPTLFPPGSTFKIVTSSTAFGRPGRSPTREHRRFPAPTPGLTLPGTTHPADSMTTARLVGNKGRVSLLYAFTVVRATRRSATWGLHLSGVRPADGRPTSTTSTTPTQDPGPGGCRSPPEQHPALTRNPAQRGRGVPSARGRGATR